MSPHSLLTLSPEVLQAAHAQAQGRGLSPHGERGERNLAHYLGLVLVLLCLPLGVLLMS